MAINLPGSEMIAFFDVLEAGIVTIAAEAEREITDDVLLQAEGLLEAVTYLSDHNYTKRRWSNSGKCYCQHLPMA